MSLSLSVCLSPSLPAPYVSVYPHPSSMYACFNKHSTDVFLVCCFVTGKSREAEVKRINKELANIRSKFKGKKTTAELVSSNILSCSNNGCVTNVFGILLIAQNTYTCTVVDSAVVTYTKMSSLSDHQ